MPLRHNLSLPKNLVPQFLAPRDHVGMKFAKGEK